MPLFGSLLTALIALFVFLKSSKVPNNQTRLTVRVVSLLIFAIAFLSSLFRTLIVVSAGNVGVTEVFGQVSSRPLNPGLHFVNPLSDVELYSTRLQDIKETIEATSQEGLAFNLDVSVQYRINPQNVVDIYRNIGTDETEIVISRFRSIIRGVTAQYPAEAIYSTNRQAVSNDIQTQLQSQLEPLGLVVEGVYLREVILPESLQSAIQDKLRAEQQSQQMQFTLEQARQEAERNRIEAQGVADSQRILAQSVTPEVLQLRSIEAMEKIAESDNSKVLILGGNEGSLSSILSLD